MLAVKLALTPDQSAALLRTLEPCNVACNAACDAACDDGAGVAFARRSANQIELQTLGSSAIWRRRGSRIHSSTRQRRVLPRWVVVALRAGNASKAPIAGVRLALVNPAYTSQTGSRCGPGGPSGPSGPGEKANRESQSQILCVLCGFSAPADATTAVNSSRAAVIPPDAALPARASCKLSASSGGL
jgi:hypothetical protein